MHTLDEVWRVRNAAAVTMGLAEDQMRRAVGAASIEEIVARRSMFNSCRIVTG